MIFFNKQKGESLVEVVLGLAILTAVLVGAYLLSAQATRITQEANERTEVSNFMRQQVEILKAAKLQYERTGDSTHWEDILSSRLSTTNYDGSCKEVPVNGSVAEPTAGVVNSFVFNPNNNFEVVDALDGNDLQDGAYFEDGKYTIWLEAYRETGVLATPYIDVFVTACWERLGGNNIERSGMVVRLNQWR